MTLKQERALRFLPEVGYNLKKAMEQAGYSKSSAISQHPGSPRDTLRKVARELIDPEQVKRKILKAERDFTKEKDNSNRARMLELQAKISKLTQDGSLQGVAIFSGLEQSLPQLPKEVIEPIESQQVTAG